MINSNNIISDKCYCGYTLGHGGHMNKPRLVVKAITSKESVGENSTETLIIDHSQYYSTDSSNYQKEELHDNEIKSIITESNLLSDHLNIAQKNINEFLTRQIEENKK